MASFKASRGLQGHPAEAVFEVVFGQASRAMSWVGTKCRTEESFECSSEFHGLRGHMWEHVVVDAAPSVVAQKAWLSVAFVFNRSRGQAEFGQAADEAAG